ncbi:hypothetical protein MSPP1_004129 [Malassezia sp. CBS 17886]|nr:hypothetical protein MSPP1_004129 [Malassezia sp. CBS 17886]
MSARLHTRQGPWQPVIQTAQPIQLVRCCPSPLAKGLVVIDMLMAATEHTVHVHEAQLQANRATLQFREVASFFIGCGVVGVAWSPACTFSSADVDEDGMTSEWKIELIVATELRELRLLRALGPDPAEENVVLCCAPEDITDVAWCTAAGYEQYLAAAGLDGTLFLCDLDATHVRLAGVPLGASLLAVAFHAKLPKLLLAVDASGVSRLVDWLAAIAAPDDACVALSFSDAPTLARYTAHATLATGAGAWQPQDADVVGTLYGTRWGVWNVGGKGSAVPLIHGDVGVYGAAGRGRFRWCPTNARLFATLTPSVPGGGAVPGAPMLTSVAPVHVFDSAFPTGPRALDANMQTPYRAEPVDLDTVGDGDAAARLSTEEAVSDVDWLSYRVGVYDVLLIAVGRTVVCVPAS